MEWHFELRCLQCFFPLSFFVDGFIVYFCFSITSFSFLILTTRAFISSGNGWRQSWSTTAMIILSISNSHFCDCIVFIIWKMYGSRFGLRLSQKKRTEQPNRYKIFHLCKLCFAFLNDFSILDNISEIKLSPMYYLRNKGKLGG